MAMPQLFLCLALAPALCVALVPPIDMCERCVHQFVQNGGCKEWEAAMVEGKNFQPQHTQGLFDHSCQHYVMRDNENDECGERAHELCGFPWQFDHNEHDDHDDNDIYHEYDPCEGKGEGESCDLCAPSDTNCMEATVAKTCQFDSTNDYLDDSNGLGCLSYTGLLEYDACEGKGEGESCNVCAPSDTDCVETTGTKTCQFVSTNDYLECLSDTMPLDPCAGKACGDECHNINDVTMVMKYCQPDGLCTPNTTPDCSAEYDACEGKGGGESCDLCAPSDSDCVETTAAKACQFVWFDSNDTNGLECLPYTVPLDCRCSLPSEASALAGSADVCATELNVGNCMAVMYDGESGGGNLCVWECCGNGYKEGSEECDDGNIDGDDGCSASCMYESYLVKLLGTGLCQDNQDPPVNVNNYQAGVKNFEECSSVCLEDVDCSGVSWNSGSSTEGSILCMIHSPTLPDYETGWNYWGDGEEPAEIDSDNHNRHGGSDWECHVKQGFTASGGDFGAH